MWVRSMQKKEQLREQCKQIRREMTEEEVKRKSRMIVERLLESKLFQNADHVLFYYPLGKEVDILPAAVYCLQNGKQIAFPKVYGDEMTFFAVTDMSQFEPGAFGIMEPVTEVAVDWKDALVLVPGLGFDRTGGRIGYGKGYYDRYCGDRVGLHLMGVAYDWQILEHIPCDTRDVALDHLITDKEIIFRRSRWN